MTTFMQRDCRRADAYLLSDRSCKYTLRIQNVSTASFYEGVLCGPEYMTVTAALQVRLREPEAFQLDDFRAISFAEVAERTRALQVSFLKPGCSHPCLAYRTVCVSRDCCTTLLICRQPGWGSTADDSSFRLCSRRLRWDSSRGKGRWCWPPPQGALTFFATPTGWWCLRGNKRSRIGCEWRECQRQSQP